MERSNGRCCNNYSNGKEIGFNMKKLTKEYVSRLISEVKAENTLTQLEDGRWQLTILGDVKTFKSKEEALKAIELNKFVDLGDVKITEGLISALIREEVEKHYGAM